VESLACRQSLDRHKILRSAPVRLWFIISADKRTGDGSLARSIGGM
jgi:hypothetical protein